MIGPDQDGMATTITGTKSGMINSFILTPFFLDEALPGLKTLPRRDWTVNEPDLPPGTKQARIAVINKELARLVAEAASAGRRPVSLAGDCLSAIGVLAGLQKAGIDPCLLWFDAHGDFNTWETTPSGFLGGMPLAMIAGRGDQSIVREVGLRPLIESRIILTDARDLDPKEKALLGESKVIRLADPKRLRHGLLPDRPLYIHVDTDVITPDQAPAQNYPVPGGVSVVDLQDIFRYLAERYSIVAVSVSSWNPELDRDKSSEKAGLLALEALIG